MNINDALNTLIKYIIENNIKGYLTCGKIGEEKIIIYVTSNVKYFNNNFKEWNNYPITIQKTSKPIIVNGKK